MVAVIRWTTSYKLLIAKLVDVYIIQLGPENLVAELSFLLSFFKTIV